MKKSLYLLVTVLGLISCSETQEAKTTPMEETQKTEKVAVVADSELDLEISGMTCEFGCKGAIEKALNQAPGIEVASVDFPTETATVKYDSKVTSQEEIIEVIQTLANGAYSAQIADPNSKTEAPIEGEVSQEPVKAES